MSFIYLGSPYSDPDPSRMLMRFELAQWATYQIITKKNKSVYSPIVHWHEMAHKFKMRTDWEYWRHFDFAMIASCHTIGILHIDGWAESKGLTEELEWAHRLNTPEMFVRIFSDGSVGFTDEPDGPPPALNITYDAMLKAKR